jgi:hypothetical protein
MKDIRVLRRMLGTLKCTIMDMIFFDMMRVAKGRWGC